MKATLSQFDSDLINRIISSLVLVGLVLVIDLWSPAFTLLCASAAGLAFWEWYTIVNQSKKVKRLTTLSMIVVLFPMVMSSHLSLMLGILGLILTGATLFLFLTFFYSLRHSFILVLGIPYIGIPLNMLVWMRSDSEIGLLLIIYIFFVTWGSDTLAYFVGKKIGGKKLAPTISPQKTWAGFWGSALGGVIGALIALLLAMAMGETNRTEGFGLSHIFELHWGLFVLISACLGLIGQIGDLLESTVKRHYKIKDSGDLIPGHGGILDRIDALLAISLAVAVIHYTIKAVM